MITNLKELYLALVKYFLVDQENTKRNISMCVYVCVIERKNEIVKITDLQIGMFQTFLTQTSLPYIIGKHTCWTLRPSMKSFHQLGIYQNYFAQKN